MAAGASTRMKSSRSKLLHDLLGRPLVVWAYELVKGFSKQAVVVVGHQAEQVKSTLKASEASDCAIHFALQDPPRGTGDAIKVALAELQGTLKDDDTLFIMGADAVLLRPESLADFLQQHAQSKAVFSFITTRLIEPGAYGRVIHDAGRVKKIVEAKNATPEELSVNEVNAGFYLIQAKTLREFLHGLQANAKTQEFYLTDLVGWCFERSLLVKTFELKDATEALGINTQLELAEARRVMQARINTHWLLNGVEMKDPSTTWIEVSAELSADVSLEPNVQVRGQSCLASGVCVGSHSILIDAKVSEDVKIHPYSHLEKAILGKRVEVGPFARLRPGTELKECVKIGNFVEVKKSVFEAGSKANHLSYVGDAFVGEKSNIGAGTITCNYDGFSKSETHIGKNVFIGSNTALVAPVRLKDGSIIGAGSTIYEDVPEDAIALERAEQKNIVGAAKKYRDKRKKT